jgi:DivIVA domain-containing protein
MGWVFAILAVLALGGIAAVAAGRGAPLSEAYDDRPDAVVPATGRLVGEDLRRVRFSLAFRGYRMSEVDALLDRVARELEDAEQPDLPRPDVESPPVPPADTSPPRPGGRGDTESH